MTNEEQQKALFEKLEKAEHYQKLIESPEWQEFLSDAEGTMDAAMAKLIGDWRSPNSGCKNWEEYLRVKSHLHGFVQAIKIPEYFITLAKETKGK